MALFLASVQRPRPRRFGARPLGARATSWDDPRANLAVVAGLARPHGLSVLDVQLTALYDPRGAVDVALVTEAGPCLPFLTRPVLREVLAHLVERPLPWAPARRALRVTYDGTAFLLDAAPSRRVDVADARRSCSGHGSRPAGRRGLS